MGEALRRGGRMMAQGDSYVGIDVAKAWLDVGSWPASENLRVGHDAAALRNWWSVCG
jgi:hypothetical protein